MENQQLPQGYYPSFEDEVTLKSFLNKLKDYAQEWRKNWKLILLIMLPFLGYQLYLRFTSDPVYTANLTFMVNDSKGSSIGGFLGQFSGLVGEDQNKLEKILELSKSRKTISNAIFKKVKIDGKEDYYANHIINHQKLHKEWKSDYPAIKDFNFKSADIDKFSVAENLALREVHYALVGNEKVSPIFTTKSNKKTGIMTFTLKTFNEELSIGLIQDVYNSLRDYYVNSTIRKEKETYDLLLGKRDSLEKVLNRNDVSTAVHDDQNNNLLLNVDKVPVKRYARTNNLLTALYAEVMKNTELAEFALKTATPFISLIDEPIPPINPKRKGGIVDILAFMVIGLLIGITYVSARYGIRKSLEE